MPTRIDHLTDEQKARMESWADQWIAKGLCTDPADFDAFERGAAACYRHAGIPWHGRVVRVSSPLVLALAAPIADKMLGGGAVDGAVDGAVSRAVRGAVYGAVYGAVHDAVYGAVDGAVDGAVSRAVRGAVRGAVYGAVRGAVDGAVSGAVSGAVDDHVLQNWHRYLGGQWWLSWQAYESFFREVCGLVLPDDMNQRAADYALAQQSAGWWWPHRQFVMVCDRPEIVKLERVGPRGWGSHRLHCPNGPAIRWRDGWSLYFWHGVRVEPDWIERKDAVDTMLALTEQNLDRRRALAEILGWERVLSKLPHRVIDANPRADIGTLIEVDLPDAPHQRFLRVRCGTGRTFCLKVPSEMRTAHEANNWGYNEPADAPIPELRT